MLLSALFLMASSAQAGVIVDQQNTSTNADFEALGTSPSAGQSFTPTLALIDFATFNLGVTAAATYRVDLYSGDGFGGAVLGSSSSQALPVIAGFGGEQPVEFDFSSQIAISPGSVFTLRLVDTSAPASLGILSRDSSSNPYAGGVEYVFGFSIPGNDLVFSEGIHTTATPEPSSFVTGFLGLGLTATAWLRRKKARILIAR